MKKQKRFVLLLLLSAITYIAFASPLNSSVGIGIQFSLDSSRGYKIPIVIRVMPDAPAEVAGIKVGDFIIAANGAALKSLTLDAVAKYIAGEEGTVVELDVERSGNSLSFTITRASYKYANAYYTNSNTNDGFCEAITQLMNDAPYDFKHTKGPKTHIDSTGKSFASTHFKSYVTVPGVISTEFTYQLLSTYAEIVLAKGTVLEDVGRKTEEYANKIKACFPDCYYDKQRNDITGLPSLAIGRNFTHGFEEPGLTLQIYKNDDGVYQAVIYINNGDKTKFTYPQNEPKDDAFSTAIRKIVADIPNKFENVKGVKHESKGMFSTTWYEAEPVPDGLNCSIGRGMFSSGCDCLSYEGSSYDDADKAFTALATGIRDALGSSYCYNSEKPELSMSIPSTVVIIYNFANKKKKGYESCPVVSVYMDKDKDGKYYVKALFDNSGM